MLIFQTTFRFLLNNGTSFGLSVANAVIRSATKEYDTSPVVADITLIQIPCGFRYCVTPGSLSPAVFQRPLTSSIALFPRAPLLGLLPGRPPSLLLLLLLLLLPASLLTLRSPSSKAGAVFFHVSLYVQPSPFLSHSLPRPSRESVVRGHLVAWLLGYSVTDRGGTRREKRIERTSDRSRYIRVRC